MTQFSSYNAFKIIYLYAVAPNTIVVIWDRWWLLSKYLWIYIVMVSLLFPSHPMVKEVLVGSLPGILVLFSYLGRKGGLEAVYLIKADWDFQWMHSRSRVLPGGVYYWCNTLRTRVTYGPFSLHIYLPPHSYVTTDSVGIKTMTCMCLLLFVSVCVCVAGGGGGHIYPFIPNLLFGSEVIHDVAVLSLQSVLGASPLTPSTGN